MITLLATKAQLNCAGRTETLTSGMRGAVTVKFSFSQDWDGLTKTAVFSAGDVTKSVVLSGDEADIPWECLAAPNLRLLAGVYGTDGNRLVLPTVYCSLGYIHQGAESSAGEAAEATPTLLQQLMASVQSVRDDADAGAFDGRSAYASAAEGGYTGTEAAFYADLAGMQGLADELAKL